MELNQLKCFLEVARLEHITQAADQLHITQPALSKVIARLEDDLGVKLFDREGKNIRLNEYGRVAQNYAQRIMYTIGDMEAELAEMSAGQAGNLRIGSSFPAQEPNWILECIRTFALQRPDVGVRLRQYSAARLRSALEEREIDLALSTIPIRGEGVEWRELFVEKMGKELSLADLSRERFYCNNANSDVQELTYVFCERAGFTPNIHFECEFPSYIGEAVSLGHGISLISERGYLRSLNKKDRRPWEDAITFRPLKEDWCCRMCGIAHLSERYLPQAVREFYQFLVASFPV